MCRKTMKTIIDRILDRSVIRYVNPHVSTEE